MTDCPEIKLGFYRHYKGGNYEVLHLARDSETAAWLVVYRALYGERGLWVRPATMFAETVEQQGARIARFAYQDNPPSSPEQT